MTVRNYRNSHARLKNLDMLLNILKDRQKQARKAITKEFDELMRIPTQIGSEVTKAGPVVQKLAQEKDEVSGSER